MQFISECFEEHHKRWSKVGQMTGFTHSPRDLTPLGTDQPTVFSIPRRHYSMRLPDSALSTYSMSSLTSRPRSLRQSRYSRNSAGTLSNGSRNSDPFGIPPHQLPSLEEKDSENGHQSPNKDCGFASDTTSVEESPVATPQISRSSVGSRSIGRSNSNPTSHSHAFQQSTPEAKREERSTSESGRESANGPDKSGIRKFRSRERIKKRPGAAEPVAAQLMKDTEDSTDSSSVHSVTQPMTRGSCKSLNKVSLSSEV